MRVGNQRVDKVVRVSILSELVRGWGMDETGHLTSSPSLVHPVFFLLFLLLEFFNNLVVHVRHVRAMRIRVRHHVWGGEREERRDPYLIMSREKIICVNTFWTSSTSNRRMPSSSR